MSLKADRLEFHISYECGNNCVFCSEANRLKRFRGKNPSVREIAGILRDKRAEGVNYVAFTGGEPSLLKDLPVILRLASALGYKTSLTTNGRAFADPRYSAKNLPALDEVILSVHGAGSLTHDSLTRTPGSFLRTAAALRNINALAGKRLFLITNTLAVKDNFRELPRILNWLGGLGAVKQMMVSYPAPEGRAASGYAGLAVDLREFAAMVPKLVAVAARHKKILKFFGVPACALGPFAGHSNDLHWSPRITVERGGPLGAAGFREVLSTAPVRKRHYGAACLGCGLVGICGGVFSGQRGLSSLKARDGRSQLRGGL
ncbi:MAG: hypothetical protein COT18_08205 [Elusimicrobia bacterium CG08_land_8_20_14_0_20_59_10]|nr:MAG: hypothetical protein COT18_08205 [Elusimicrobia bacterium CG08_land_8_20_14_0_20_59_10]